GRLMYEGRWLEPQSLMLRESIQKWVGSEISGSVTVRLRRGEDYSILDTSGPSLSYAGEKLSMERVEDAAFGPGDRIGQLTMRNLDIADSRARLENYVARGIIGGTTGDLIGELQQGEAKQIAKSVNPIDNERLDSVGESAAFDTGTD
ncbi:MAG: argininosuccinate synthase, partial [Candidatus Microbacterium stercoravium]